MKTTQGRHRLAGIAAVLLIAVVEASAQEAFAARSIIVSIPDRKLVLLDGGHVLKIYDVAVGKPSTPSPTGEFRIIAHVANPTWYGHGKVVPAGPHNPVGTRWMGLSIKGYGIHGTNAPGSIGKAASHGCIRMRNRDAEELFKLVSVGVPVELVGGPQDFTQLSAVQPPQLSNQPQSLKGE